jgi:DNA-binding MarR family transcriptional regulator
MNQQVRDFRKTVQALEKVIDAQVASCCPGLSMAQCHALLAIEALGSTTVSQLAGRLGLDSSTVSRTVEGLVRNGVIKRRRDSKDRRVVRIQLSEKGKSSCRNIHDASDEYYSGVLQRIPARDVDVVMKRFNQLVDAFVRHETVREQAATCCDDDEG